MDQKLQIADRLKQANNILVTVSNNPSVDQLASCIGLTLVLNKMGKHASAVFSGTVPNTIEFLQPEKTIEATTDSLRDFIISLDKSKADKLRYKVEDKVVKIFITPYRTSISDKDLEFSQGDFNVDVVIAMGVHSQAELDQAITAHGRILHDATVATINTKPGEELGSLNWTAPAASSLCELLVDLVNELDKQAIDSQIATAFLTGIVAETSRFSNEKTSPDTMSISAELMAAGANQQLVASKLEEPEPIIEQQAPAAPAPPPAEPAAPAEQQAPPAPEAAEPPKSEDGTLEITHTDQPSDGMHSSNEPEDAEHARQQIDIDEQGSLRTLAEMEERAKAAKAASTDPMVHMGSGHKMLQPTPGDPASGDAPADGPLSLPQPADDDRPSGAPMPSPGAFESPSQPPAAAPPPSGSPAPASFAPPTPAVDPTPPPAMPPTAPSPVNLGEFGDTPGTLAVPAPPPTSPVVGAPFDDAHLSNARDAVTQAISGQPSAMPEPIHALNAQPLGDQLHANIVSTSDNTPPDLSQPVGVEPPHMSMTPPPPVPPPMMPTSAQ